MADNPKQDILVNPRWSILMDGHGYRVLAVEGMPQLLNGKKVVVFYVKPDDIVVKRYNWKKGVEIPPDGKKKIVCNEEDIIPLNPYDDANRTWLYVKSFNGEPTALSEREALLKIKLDNKDRKISLLEGENIKLAEQLERAKLSVGKYVNESAIVFEKATEGLGRMMNQKKENQNG